MAKWTKIGEVGVDAGCVMIVDPCYVLAGAGRDEALAYDRAVGLDVDSADPRSPNNVIQSIQEGNLSVLELPDVFGGYLVPSGYGDGAYPIYARIEPSGRITGVMVDFGGDLSEDDLPIRGSNEDIW